jgi:hypothetical protein
MLSRIGLLSTITRLTKSGDLRILQFGQNQLHKPNVAPTPTLPTEL